MTNLLISMEAVRKMFERYAKKDEDATTISKGELRAWLQAELPGYLQDAENEQEIQHRVDKLMQNLDEDRDGEMNFLEFIDFVNDLTLVRQPGPCQDAK
ncbi:protein S100-P-like [Xyrichtys novacula]|uniref:Protein S100 n=1 Tax=Xyrichtys novacula TaxID=13765 RepID=A0AAV1HKY6_XYRNO|nr:protein S100-P-like [Xyrichtys novacula]